MGLLQRLFHGLRRRDPELTKKTGGKVAVLLIDMQPYFVEKLAEEVQNALVAEQKRIIRCCAATDTPLFVLEYMHWGKTLKELRREITKVPRVKTITKRKDDGFTVDELDECLQKLGISTLLLTGINASYCVLKTAKSAVKHGYRVITADNLIANCKCAECAALNKDRTWYEANGTFHTTPVAPADILFLST